MLSDEEIEDWSHELRDEMTVELTRAGWTTRSAPLALPFRHRRLLRAFQAGERLPLADLDELCRRLLP